MPSPNARVPSYRLYKPSGQARVIVNREHIYLGKYGSAESREKYARLIAERAFADRQAPQTAGTPAKMDPISINEMLLAYWRFAQALYQKDGQPTKELACMREALRPVKELYGSTPAGEFGPKALKAVRRHMVDQGLSRAVVNHRLSRIKRAFKWATGEELIPSSVFHGLQAVGGLRFGQTQARETKPIRPIADLYVALGWFCPGPLNLGMCRKFGPAAAASLFRALVALIRLVNSGGCSDASRRAGQSA